MYHNRKTQEGMTALPEKYPQKYFREKECRWCGDIFTPKAPSHLYCSTECSIKSYDNNYLLKSYGISLEGYKDLLERQESRCAICGGEGFSLAKHKARETLKLVVDHDHSSGQVRGLLCHNCNRALGLFKENIVNLFSAIQYLESVTTIPEGSRTKRSEAPDLSYESDDIV